MNLKFSAFNNQAIFVIFLSFLFSLALDQSPLFTENQNTYLLQGVAKSYGPPLNLDWLANQTDTTPIFSLIVKFFYSISNFFFYFFHALISLFLILALYFISVKLGLNNLNKISASIFFFIFFLVEYYLGILNIGAHGQFILGKYFQPSVFGIFIIVSLAFFLYEKYLLAILLCLIASYFHSSYILQSAFIISTYQFILIKNKKNGLKDALIYGIFAVILIIPLVFYLYLNFLDVDPNLLKTSQEILVYKRMYPTAVPSEWLTRNRTILAFFLIISCCWFYRKNFKVKVILMLPLFFVFCIILSTYLFENLTLNLLFAQRASVWLVPIATSLLIGKLSVKILKINFFFSKKILLFLFTLILTILAIRGIYKTYVAHNIKFSNNFYYFLSKLDYSNGSLLVPTSEKNIRLNAKVPIFIDLKSHPYKASEVIEWHERVELANNFYGASSDTQRIFFLKKILKKERISYILIDSKQSFEGCNYLYNDEKLKIYKISQCFKDLY